MEILRRLKKRIMLTIAVLIVLATFPIYIRYSDNNVPVKKYEVFLNKFTLTLTVKSTTNSSTVDKKLGVVKNKVKLTFDEYEKVMYAVHLKFNEYDRVMMALDSLAMDSKCMYKAGEPEYSEMQDINRDRILTYREFGNACLEDLVLGR